MDLAAGKWRLNKWVDVSFPGKELILPEEKAKHITELKDTSNRSYGINQLFGNSLLTTPDPICWRIDEPLSVVLFPVMKVGGHMDGRRLVKPLSPLNDEMDPVLSMGTLVLPFGPPL